jgi:cell division protein FtsW (lipid II flippase)
MNQSDRAPMPVVIALCSIGVSLALAPVRSLEMDGWERPLLKASALVILICLGGAWVWGLYRRKNWLRWLTIVAGVTGLFALPTLVPLFGRDMQGSLYLAQCVLSVFGAALLALPVSSRWFSSGT